MSLATSEGAAQVLAPGVAGMRQEKNPAVLAPYPALSQLGFETQHRPQHHVIRQDQRGDDQISRSLTDARVSIERPCDSGAGGQGQSHVDPVGHSCAGQVEPDQGRRRDHDQGRSHPGADPTGETPDQPHDRRDDDGGQKGRGHDLALGRPPGEEELGIVAQKLENRPGDAECGQHEQRTEAVDPRCPAPSGDGRLQSRRLWDLGRLHCQP